MPLENLETIIGLEVHAQMNTQTKMFCGCSNDAFGKPPNTTVCPICMGHPGTLPVPNGEAIVKAITTALALGCDVQPHCHFDRKHYFYPDLPAGFQISQYDFPLATGGRIAFDLPSATAEGSHAEGLCKITRLHIENDAGKLTHRGKFTLCDFNRAGTPLMEIVTEPDLRSPEEAVAFVQELRRILIAVGASEADMYKGMMRFDASISLRERGKETLNPRSEIKNLNSFKALEKALTYEEQRLRRLWQEEHGPLQHNITVGWLDEGEATRVLREKETADDYRYFPDPDIPPLSIDAAKLKEIRTTLPPLPRAMKQQYRGLGLSDAEAECLVADTKLRALFDAVHGKTKDGKRASSIVLTQLLGFLNASEKDIGAAPPTEHVLTLVERMEAGAISANAGKEVLEAMVETGKSPIAIIEERGLTQMSNDAALEDLVKRAIAENPGALLSFKKGKPQALGAIVGWVMKETKGKANPVKVSEILQRHV